MSDIKRTLMKLDDWLLRVAPGVWNAKVNFLWWAGQAIKKNQKKVNK